MTPDPALQAALLDDPQPLLGGTLWLMTRFHEAPCPVLARRIVDNLERLAAHPFCGDPLRAVCGTLRAQWAARCLRTELGLERASARPTGRGRAESAAGPAAGDGPPVAGSADVRRLH